ncbi:MAG TPA: hypothetical protein DDW27_13280 [Bacteroidales bacterium]|nr:hypothetical protein [Bacteroidales bacterium]
MIIERTKSEIIFRLPKNVNIDLLQDLADFFEFREIANKSKAKQEDIDSLVKKIKKGRWDLTKKQNDL